MKHLSDLQCPMSDRILLNFDLYRPDAEGAYPVILMRTPYSKSSLTNERLYACPERFTSAGYCVMVQECRGTGRSGGVLDANAFNEYQDGVDTVNWVAEQSWCDGNVGMFGLSYFGFTQLAAASCAPKALKAICPFMTQAAEPFGAQMTQTYNFFHLCWIYGQVQNNPVRFIPDEGRRESVLQTLREYAPRLAEYAMHLPANQNPAACVEGVPLLKDYLALINGIEDRDFWHRMRHPTDYTQAHCAMFHSVRYYIIGADEWREDTA